MPDSSEPVRVSRHFTRPSFWVASGLIVLFAIFAIPTAGFGGFLIMLAFGCLLTGLYSLVTGRGSWASIPSRKVAALVAAAAVVAAIVGGALVPADGGAGHRADSAIRLATSTPAPVQAPQFAFTAESAADPSHVTEPAGSASAGTALVAIADSSTTDTTALALLATLPVKGKAPMTGYARTVMFGAAWIDQDRNGCDTRNDILSRDLAAVAKSGSCRVLSGRLRSPYTGQSIDFVRGNRTSTAVQIDHVVSLGDAWRTGARQLTQGQRVALANDPINLFAVDGRSNEQKSDGDTATWLPAAKAFRCEYVSHQVSVKATYGLWVTPAEHAAMLRVLTTCPAQAAVSSPFASAPKPVVDAPPVVAPAPQPAPVKAAPAPAPVAPAPVAPAPAPPPAGVVHPGAFCSTAGATGVTAKGTAMRCTTTATDARLRWRAA